MKYRLSSYEKEMKRLERHKLLYLLILPLFVWIMVSYFILSI